MNKRLIGAAVCAVIVLTACGSGSESATSSAPSAAAAPAGTVTVTATTTRESTRTDTATVTVTETAAETSSSDDPLFNPTDEDGALCAAAKVIFPHLDKVEAKYASGENPQSSVVSEAEQAQSSIDGITYFFKSGGGTEGLEMSNEWTMFKQQVMRLGYGGPIEDFQTVRSTIKESCAAIGF